MVDGSKTVAELDPFRRRVKPRILIAGDDAGELYEKGCGQGEGGNGKGQRGEKSRGSGRILFE